ncbi:hypothetical protein [Cardinium endosymbiont of Culicoides punctatus]|uniref:hypothetical protein n=1 Tax=Cardinium endosymbiont of Culicoides punctatus TaxID=2304601 RepID=UPI001058F75F|nr:hypothetical protein [Cardinium endosymbiont of Culicoides punctatus]
MKINRLGQKGLYTWAMVGMLYIANNCGNQKPNPANIQGTKINTQYINKLGTVTQQTPRPTNTQNTQDTSKKPILTDTQHTQDINKLDSDEQQTSSPEEKESQQQTEIVTNPISEEIPKERQQQETIQTQQTPPPKEIVTEAISEVKNIINQLQLDLNTLKTKVGVMKTNIAQPKGKSFVEDIAKSIKIDSNKYKKSANSKEFAQKLQKKVNSLTNLTKKEKEIGNMICIEFDKLNFTIKMHNNLTYDTIWNKVTQKVHQTISTAVCNFDKQARSSLRNLITNLGNKITLLGRILVVLEDAITTDNKQIFLKELVNAKLALDKIALDTAKKDVNLLKTAVKGTILEKMPLNNAIINLDTKINKVNKDTKAVIQAVDNAIAAVNNLP